MDNIKNKLYGVFHKEKKPMDNIIFMRFVFYGIVLVVLLGIAIILPLTVHDIRMAVFPLVAFLGMSCLALNFMELYQKGQLIIVYAVCESKDDYPAGILDKYHAFVDRKQRKYEYRLLTVSKDGKDSYIYLVLPEYNRMREGASYKILFRKNADGTNEFSEKYMITFVQLQQDVQSYDVNSESGEEK